MGSLKRRVNEDAGAKPVVGWLGYPAGVGRIRTKHVS
jgi:hypothetical protein